MLGQRPHVGVKSPSQEIPKSQQDQAPRNLLCGAPEVFQDPFQCNLFCDFVSMRVNLEL